MIGFTRTRYGAKMMTKRAAPAGKLSSSCMYVFANVAQVISLKNLTIDTVIAMSNELGSFQLHLLNTPSKQSPSTPHIRLDDMGR